MNDNNFVFKIIKIYFCYVRFAHIDKNFENFSIFEHSILTNVIQNIKCVRKNDVVKKRKSIKKNILLKILKTFDIFIQRDVTLHVVFCLIFVVFFSNR